MDRTAYDALQAKVDALKAELPGITLGYLGNYERWGNDTHWYIFLPHYNRVGKFSDQYGIGPGKQADIFEKALAKWDEIAAALRKMYRADPNRIGMAHLDSRGVLVDYKTGKQVELGINPPPTFASPEDAAAYLRSYNTPVVVMRNQ